MLGCSNFDVLSLLCCFCAPDASIVEKDQQKGTGQPDDNSASNVTISAKVTDPTSQPVVNPHLQALGAAADSKAPQDIDTPAVPGLGDNQISTQSSTPVCPHADADEKSSPLSLPKIPVAAKTQIPGSQDSQKDSKAVGDIRDDPSKKAGLPDHREADTGKTNMTSKASKTNKTKAKGLQQKRDQFVNQSLLAAQGTGPKFDSHEVIFVDDEDNHQTDPKNTEWPGMAPSREAYDLRLALIRQDRHPKDYEFQPGTIVVYCESEVQEYQRVAFVADYDHQDATVDLIFPRKGSGSYAYTGGMKEAASAVFCFLAVDYIMQKGRRYQFFGPPRRLHAKQPLLILFRFQDISSIPKEINQMGITTIDYLDYVIFPTCKGLVLGFLQHHTYAHDYKLMVILLREDDDYKDLLANENDLFERLGVCSMSEFFTGIADSCGQQISIQPSNEVLYDNESVVVKMFKKVVNMVEDHLCVSVRHRFKTLKRALEQHQGTSLSTPTSSSAVHSSSTSTPAAAAKTALSSSVAVKSQASQQGKNAPASSAVQPPVSQPAPTTTAVSRVPAVTVKAPAISAAAKAARAEHVKLMMVPLKV